MVDYITQKKWDRAAPNFDLMAGNGAEKRWREVKINHFSKMKADSKILFLALGTGLDLEFFPEGLTIEAFDISPAMIKQAQPRLLAYPGHINAQVMDVHDMDFADNSFDQIFTSCTFCSVPRPVEGLKALKRVLKPGGQLHMFEHTGSQYYPFKIMMNLMTLISERLGPAMNRNTVENVKLSGFELIEVNNIFMDVVKTITARKPEI